MPAAAKILVVDDEKLIRWSLKEILSEQGHEVIEAADGHEGLEKAFRESPDLLLLDIRMPGLDGLTVMERVLARDPGCAVIIISAHGTMESAVDAMRRGACDFLRKPFQAEEVKLTVQRQLDKLRLSRQVELYRHGDDGRSALDTIVGHSPATLKLRDLVSKIAASDAANVLIEGESGTGKGLVAKAIHHASRRNDKPFVEVACTALQQTLVESELFGHEQGAFTDARSTKRGMFELADEGTIFLDEIGDMPLPSQAKLLKALEDRSFRRVGGVRDLKVDVRIVAATNRDLGAEAEAGTFRKDLFFRMAVLRIRLTPLRERREDVVPLAEHFVRHFNKTFRRHCQGLTAEAAALLEAHAWPGNVRELRNTIERVMILEDRERVLVEDLPDLGGGRPAAATRGLLIDIPDTGIRFEDVEKMLLIRALDKTHGNQSKAAALLGLSRDTLRYRMKKFELGGESDEG